MEALKAVLVQNDHWAAICTIIVFGGLVLEYAVLLWSEWKKMSWGKRLLTIVAALAIAGGVYGEYFFGSKAADAALKLEGMSEQQVASAQLTASESNSFAQAAALQVARLKKDAEDERLKLVEIEDRVAWRRLTNKQQSEIATRLSPFTLEIGNIWFEAGDTEGGMFASDIASALRTAKWRVFGPGSLGLVAAATANPVPIDTGVVVSSTGDKLSLRASDVIVQELTRLGFDAKHKSPRVESQPGYETIWVLVEPRPQGPQGEARLRMQRKERR